MLLVTINLGAPLDYHAILGAGAYTIIYIVSRSIGKYSDARIGATITGMEAPVRRYLGFTLLQHVMLAVCHGFNPSESETKFYAKHS